MTYNTSTSSLLLIFLVTTSILLQGQDQQGVIVSTDFRLNIEDYLQVEFMNLYLKSRLEITKRMLLWQVSSLFFCAIITVRNCC